MNDKMNFLIMQMNSLVKMLEEISEEETIETIRDHHEGRKSAFKQAAKFIKMRLKGVDEIYSKWAKLT